MKKEALSIKHHSKMIRLGSALQRFYFRPTFFGAEHIVSDRPTMYVGNHTIYGLLDTPMLIDYLYTEHKIKLVSLGDHVHFKIPFWKDLVQNMGAIEGLRAYARQAMQEGYSILVFPGGGREVVKRKGEEYLLIWKERYGFLKLAKEFNYEITPFVALGGDDVFDIAVDANILLNQKWFQKILDVPKIGKLLRQGEIFPSLPKNIIPKRIPFYFKFLPRLSVESIDTEDDLKQFRAEIQRLIYDEIDQLKRYRQQISDQ